MEAISRSTPPCALLLDRGGELCPHRLFFPQGKNLSGFRIKDSESYGLIFPACGERSHWDVPSHWLVCVRAPSQANKSDKDKDPLHGITSIIVGEEDCSPLEQGAQGDEKQSGPEEESIDPRLGRNNLPFSGCPSGNLRGRSGIVLTLHPNRQCEKDGPCDHHEYADPSGGEEVHHWPSQDCFIFAFVPASSLLPCPVHLPTESNDQGRRSNRNGSPPGGAGRLCFPARSSSHRDSQGGTVLPGSTLGTRRLVGG